MVIQNCKECGEQYKARIRIRRGRTIGSEFCSKTCKDNYYSKPIIKICSKCKEPFTSTNRSDAHATCWKPQCYKGRQLSAESRIKANTGLHALRKNCPNCDALLLRGLYFCNDVCRKAFAAKRNKKRRATRTIPVSDYCRKCNNLLDNLNNKFGKYYCSKCLAGFNKLGGMNSIKKQITSSQAEKLLYELIDKQGVTSDKTTLDGWELDIYYPKEKLAVEYRGRWHYFTVVPGYEKKTSQTMNRDRYKEHAAKINKIELYPVFWTSNIHDNKSRLKLEAYFINAKFQDINPFQFVYDLELFKQEYSKLQKAKTSSSNKHLYCINTIEFYHKHLWSYRTSSHTINSIECWELNKNKIIENRRKYADLTPRSLRRYFKLFDYAPSIFQDSIAKHLALQINGNIIADPFAGFGGRMLGVCAAGKNYIGFDIDPWTVNANQAMLKDLQLNAEIIKADTTKITPIECDGIITSPPFFNKDEYHTTFKTLKHYSETIRSAFNNFIVKDKILIDFKPVIGCDLNQFIGMLPFKYITVTDVKFGGMKRSSIHHLIECHN